MIPGKIIRFLEERATIAIAGTRDAHLVPRGHRVTGWSIRDGGRVLAIFIPQSSVPNLVEALQENGAVAVTFEELGTHETYQVKGRYLSHRAAQPAEIAIAGRVRERFVKGMRSFANGPMPDLMGASLTAPALSVEVAVHEVFLQTPGPGAGTRLVPPPGVEVPR